MNDLMEDNVTLHAEFPVMSMVTHDNKSTTDEPFEGYGLPMVVLMSTLLSIAMVVALVGNTLVILTILRNKDMRTRTNLLLSNLALADIMVSLLDIPVALYTIIMGEWRFSQAFCNFNGYFVGLGFMLSIHTLMWISIHKFISITKPFARVLTPGKIFCMILAAWGWSSLYNIGPLLGWSETVYKPGASQCGPVVPKTKLQLSHSLTNTIFNFIIPICVMSYCYYKIFAEVREHMNRLQEFADVRIRTTIVQQRRISMTLLYVLLCFLLCWIPYIMYSCTLVALGTKVVNPIFNPLAYLAGYINSACNPIIYALRSPSFRKGFHEILCGPKRVPEWKARLIRGEFAIEAPKNDLEDPDKPQPISIRGNRSISYGHRSISNGHQKSKLKGQNPNSKGSSSVTSTSLSQPLSANLHADSPGSVEQTFKWTRINGVVVSFRRSIKNKSRSSPNLEQKDEPIRKNPIKYSLAEPPSELKTFNQRRLNKQRSKIKLSEPSSVDDPKLEQKDEDSLKDKNVFRRSSESSTNSVFARNKTPIILERDGYGIRSFAEEIESQSLTSPTPETNENFTFVATLNSQNKRWSQSTPNLQIQEKTIAGGLKETVLGGILNPYLTAPEIAYMRTSSEGDAESFPFEENIIDKKVNDKSGREPPHLVWKASVEEINFISHPKERSRSLWTTSRDDDPEDGLPRARNAEHGNSPMKLGITGLITSVKRSIGDLFTAISADELDETSSPPPRKRYPSSPPLGKKYPKRHQSDSSTKAGSDSESDILISRL